MTSSPVIEVSEIRAVLVDTPTGIQGPPGPAGPQGPVGPPGPNAIANIDGGVATSIGVILLQPLDGGAA